MAETQLNAATIAETPIAKAVPLAWAGARPLPTSIILVAAALLWHISSPVGLDAKTWHLFIIFLGTIVSFIANVLPMGAVALISVATSVLTGTLSIEQTLKSFSSDIAWLVILAFFIARGFIKTGLGARLAYYFVSILGKNTLGLAYGLVTTECLLAPVIPSNTARGAGILFPILTSLTQEYDSTPKNNTHRKMGSFLVAVCFQANAITSAMFLTAIAGNPLIVGLAADAGVQLNWMTWFLAASVPGFLNLAMMPLLIYWLYPPTLKSTPEAPLLARQKLKDMGPFRREEIIMIGTFILLLTLWIGGNSFGISATASALLGLSILLLTGVLEWDDILKEKGAWDTLVWFAVLLMIANYLAEFGMIQWMSDHMQATVSNLHWVIAFVLLAVAYFYSHYFFASVTSHISAMYSAFLFVSLALGAPPVLAALTLAFLSATSCCLTHYSTGTAPAYYSAGYITLKDWWRLGAISSVAILIIWGGIGSAWWKIIGLW